jgi:uncharacterized protein YcfL
MTKCSSLLLPLMLALCMTCARAEQADADGVPPTVQVLILNNLLQDRISIQRSEIDAFADLKEASVAIRNNWHRSLAIRYKTIWYTQDGKEIVEEDNQWHDATILPAGTLKFEAIAPEDGFEAIVHVK